MGVFVFSLGQSLVVAGFLFGLIAWTKRIGLTDPVVRVVAAMVALCLLGYLHFWVAFLSYPVSLALKAALWAGGGVLLRGAVLDRAWRDESVHPLIGLVVATVVLSLWVHGATGLDSPLRTAAERWTHSLPIDNELPLLFAKFIRAGEIPTPMVGDWLSSDRPPLQVGMFLLLGLPVGPTAVVYQFCGVTLQMFAIVGVWVLMRASGATLGSAAITMAAAFFTPLVLVNGGYVWPKLLPAALLCGAVAVHFLSAAAPGRWLSGGLVGAATALAMLGHGATAFVLGGMALAAIVLHRIGEWRHVVAAAAVFVVLYSPWQAYQTKIDPPGNRLAKWHIAGVVDIDDRSFPQTMRDSLASKSVLEWLSDRRANIDAIAGNWRQMLSDTAASVDALLRGDVERARARASGIRERQFFEMTAGMGIAGVALALIPIMLAFPATRAVATVVLFSLATWVVLIFIPGQTITHQGSLFPQLGLLVGLYMLAQGLGRPAVVSLAAAQIVLTTYQYSL